MIGLKLVRETNKPQRDNLVDIAGYARVLEMTQDSKMGLAEIAKKFVVTTDGLKDTFELEKEVNSQCSETVICASVE